MHKIWQKLKSFIKNDNPQTRIKWSLYGRVWREIGRANWKWLLAGVICTTIAAAAEGFSITLVKKVIDQGFIEKNMESLFVIGLQIIAAFGAKGLFTFMKTLAMTHAGLMGATTLRRKLYRHMLKQPMGYFSKTHTGDLINYFTGMASAVLALVTDTVIKIVHNTATIIMMVGLMVWYAPQMTAVLLFLVPAVVVPLTIITRKRRKVARNTFGADASSITQISQSIEGVKTIQAFCAEDKEQQNMNAIEDRRVSLGMRQATLSGMQSPILEAMISVGLFMALMSGGYFIANGSISTGDFAAFLLALTAAYQPAKSLTNVNGGIQTGLIAAESLFEFLDTKPELTDAPDAIELQKAPMNVSLENVSFGYDRADGEILRNVTLDVPAGKTCALVGPSGGGKTTIFNLLQRFYDTWGGAVKINGRDIRSYTLHSLRNNIATVSQDVFLFAGTIADNIKYGCPNATMAQIKAAARAANAHDFIMTFPNGYEQNVGERGSALSGGQKQRIAIARAILKDAPILLLDEATSALDTESEKLIQQALKKLMRGRTTFVIAHRLTTILDSDIICVIKCGQIVERGTDAELSARDGEYKKLKDIQFKKVTEKPEDCPSE